MQKSRYEEEDKLLVAVSQSNKDIKNSIFKTKLITESSSSKRPSISLTQGIPHKTKRGCIPYDSTTVLIKATFPTNQQLYNSL